jgi:hypothetical protein
MPDKPASYDDAGDGATSGLKRRGDIEEGDRALSSDDRTSSPDAPVSGGKRGGSGEGRRRGVIAVGLAAAVAGAIGVLMMRSRGERDPHVAPEPARSAAVAAQPAATPPVALPAPQRSTAPADPAPSASASAAPSASAKAAGRAPAARGSAEPVTVDTGVPLDDWPAKPPTEADPYGN